MHQMLCIITCAMPTKPGFNSGGGGGGGRGRIQEELASVHVYSKSNDICQIKIPNSTLVLWSVSPPPTPSPICSLPNSPTCQTTPSPSASPQNTIKLPTKDTLKEDKPPNYRNRKPPLKEDSLSTKLITTGPQRCS